MSFIKFCEHCDNYMILKIIEENETQSLQYYCNNCGNINKKVEEKCINYNNYDLQKIYIQDRNIKYLADDPTIPRVNNITCPNNECSKVGENEVVYITIDEDNMKYLYICRDCKTSWKTE